MDGCIGIGEAMLCIAVYAPSEENELDKTGYPEAASAALAILVFEGL